MVHIVRPTDDNCICPTCPILASITPQLQRNVAPLSYDRFCAVLETGDFDSFHEIAGLQIIQLPRAILINNGGTVTQVVVKGTDLEAFYNGALMATDDIALAA